VIPSTGDNDELNSSRLIQQKRPSNVDGLFLFNTYQVARTAGEEDAGEIKGSTGVARESMRRVRRTRAQSIRNLLSKWHTLPPEAAFFEQISGRHP